MRTTAAAGAKRGRPAGRPAAEGGSVAAGRGGGVVTAGNEDGRGQMWPAGHRGSVRSRPRQEGRTGREDGRGGGKFRGLDLDLNLALGNKDNDWVVSNDRKSEVKNLGKIFADMFSYVPNRMTLVDSIALAATVLVHVIGLLRREKIPLPAFNSESPVHEFHEKDEWHRHGIMVEQEFSAAASLIHVESDKELKDLIQEEMKFNNTFSRQSFCGIEITSVIAEMFSKKRPFVHAYLSSVNETKRLGEVKYHLIIDYDTTADGKVFPITSGAFNKKVSLPSLPWWIC